jgi:hypothetical protein
MAVVLLTVMTAFAPLRWERVEIDADSGASIARCSSESMNAFVFPLAAIMMISTVLTGVMAWKTQDVDTSFSDAFWVGVLIVVQIEVRVSHRMTSFPRTLQPN